MKNTRLYFFPRKPFNKCTHVTYIDDEVKKISRDVVDILNTLLSWFLLGISVYSMYMYAFRLNNSMSSVCQTMASYE